MRVLLFLLLVSISAHAQITGTWKANDQGEPMILILNQDGTGTLDGDRLKYTAQSGVFTVTMVDERETHNYKYELNGNTLTISGGDLDHKIVFKKAVEQSATPKTSSNNNSILGAWSGNNETMEFKSDGTCIYAGHSFKYIADNGQLKLSMPEGLVVIPYTLKNGKLIINVDGQDYTYNRGTASAAATTYTGTKNIPKELAGKWCWVNVTSTNSGGSSSDACITLNEDGTYSFYSERSMSATDQSFSAGTNSATSDRGTWWVQGARIYYNSESRGQGSYKFEKRNHPTNPNDPMIVLDGQPFVTQYQKAPWR